MKKLLTILMCLMLVVVYMPTMAFAAETSDNAGIVVLTVDDNEESTPSDDEEEGTPGDGDEAEQPGDGDEAEQPGDGDEAEQPGDGDEAEKPGDGEDNQGGNGSAGGGGGIYVPGTPVDAMKTTKTEAINSITNIAKAEKYEEAEQAQVNAILENAKKEIEAAKTDEEIKAIEKATKEAIEAIDTAEEKAIIRRIESVDKSELKLKSTRTTLNGKKAIKLTWKVPEDLEFDGFDVFRSTKKYSGFGTKPFFTSKTTKYTNNKNLKVGKTYYYKVRAYKVVNGRKVYTGWSTKAWRTIK